MAFFNCFPTLFLSGIIWPPQSMPLVLQKISLYLPTTAAAEAMRQGLLILRIQNSNISVQLHFLLEVV